MKRARVTSAPFFCLVDVGSDSGRACKRIDPGSRSQICLLYTQAYSNPHHYCSLHDRACAELEPGRKRTALTTRMLFFLWRRPWTCQSIDLEVQFLAGRNSVSAAVPCTGTFKGDNNGTAPHSSPSHTFRRPAHISPPSCLKNPSSHSPISSIPRNPPLRGFQSGYRVVTRRLRTKETRTTTKTRRETAMWRFGS